MSKLKRHRPLLMLTDSVLTKMSTKRLLAHYQKSKIVSECVPNWDEPSPVIPVDTGVYLVNLLVLLAKRENLA